MVCAACGVRRGGSKAEVRLERHKEEGYVMRLPSASDEQLLDPDNSTKLRQLVDAVQAKAAR